MEFSLTLGKYILKVESEKNTPNASGALLTGTDIRIQLPFVADQFYCHGWQSWSLTAWLDTREELAPSFPVSLHASHIDLPYAFEKKPNGSWLGAVNTPDGKIILLGSLGLESHVKYDGDSLCGSYEHGNGDWFLAYGLEQDIFQKYAFLLGDRFGKTRLKDSPRIWCSWYSFYKEIKESTLLRIINEMGDLAFDVIQVDDGWQKKVGDWEANEKFPSGMQALADSIKLTGRKAGLWLAPLIAVQSSSIFQNHQGWLLHDAHGRLVQAGVNWHEKFFALDTTHPQVLEMLAELMQKVRTWGYDYVKLDFLFAGALPGQRYVNIPRETAYRQGLETIRLALGDAYLLTCGAPILPTLGLCDAIRVGPDVSDVWNLNLESRLMNNFAVPGAQNAIRTTLNRLWLKPIVHTDPDVVYFHSRNISLSNEQKQLLKYLAYISEFKATSDLPSWLTASERQELQLFLTSKPEIKYISQYKYQINGSICDLSESIKFPKSLNWFENLIRFFIGNLANISIAFILFDKFFSIERRKSDL
ncbi:MAG: hypothetical protein A2X25_02020 [Chloroflexi bacterium GWB2_49_20]|nr:MAG: hypothetical protein A2X25_02020 [Chloroflexi bacterium GWB2_49_20]OGN78223.1 MAG: hypothetical protein A2X26_14625 [Chloroflexi bacterium GWC2_49_37]OGN85259.1 MAG: hypothetical protein A2X27_07280 [Chloroflexi bacterium GWD2_49_16]